jgi:UDP-N-acetylglucosamine acyltransferase
MMKSPDLKLLRSESDGTGSRVDPRADVHPTASIGDGCVVGAFAVVGAGVTMGEGCVVHPHAVVTGPTVMGAGNEMHPFSCIGGAPQDLRHRKEPTLLEVGCRNEFREYVTVNRGTLHGGGVTRIGDDNLIMAYSHIAHDCILGNRVVMANGSTLAGHVRVQDYAVFGGMVAVGAFLRIGESAMMAAGSMLERDVAPFSMVGGNRARLCGVNRVGLRRRGFSDESVRQIYRIIRRLRDRDVTCEQIVNEFSAQPDLCPHAAHLIDFLNTLEKGIIR